MGREDVKLGVPLEAESRSSRGMWTKGKRRKQMSSGVEYFSRAAMEDVCVR